MQVAGTQEIKKNYKSLKKQIVTEKITNFPLFKEIYK